MRHPQKVIDRAAYQIWHLIQRTGGDCTVHDMAEVTGLSRQACGSIAHNKGWSCDYRKVSRNPLETSFLDSRLTDLEQWA